MSIVKYKDDLLNIILSNNDSSFSSNGHNLGLKIYKLGGSKALYSTMNLLLDELSNEYSNEYLEHLRLLEFSWNNICDEWQA